MGEIKRQKKNSKKSTKHTLPYRMTLKDNSMILLEVHLELEIHSDEVLMDE
jgi:hypothetical protein